MNNQNIHTGEDMPIKKEAEKKKFPLKVNNKEHNINKSVVTRADILDLAEVGPFCRFQVYQELNPHKELKLISEGQMVDLAEPGIEKFITKKIEQVTYHLCDEPFTTVELYLTPSLILQQKFANNWNQYYLKQLVGQTQVSYEGKPDEKITMCPDLRFLYIFTGPMTVS